MRTLLFILTIIPMLVSCKKEKKRPVYYAETPATEIATSHSGEEVIIPYREEGGVKYVDVKVNGVAFEMIFDTGCSGTLISLAEASYLFLKDQLTIDDFQGVSRSMIAENMVVKLREVTIADKVVCPDVIATVSTNLNAPLLLGNEVLDRVATITIDNERKELKFKLK